MTRPKPTASAPGEAQIDKFRQLARELGANEDPEAFKAKLVKIARASRPAAEKKR